MVTLGMRVRAVCAGSDQEGRGERVTTFRVVRGGNWYWGARHCRPAGRYASDPLRGGIELGFRPVMQGPLRKILRGGSWRHPSTDTRCAYRGDNVPGITSALFGVRPMVQ